MKLKILKFLYKPFIYSRYYKYWSKLYRFLFQRQYKTKIIKNSSLKSLAYIYSDLEWRKDGFKELWDVCEKPEWVQYCINHIAHIYGHQPKGSLDCDAFAIHALHAYSCDAHQTSKLLGVTYLKDGKLSGHMVCLIWDSAEDACYHIGNWGLFGPMKFKEVISHIVGDNQFIGWTTYDKNLNVLNSSTKEF